MIEDNPYLSPDEASDEGDSGSSLVDGQKTPRRGVKGSVCGALVLLVLDAGFTGSCLHSLLACPIWLLVSILKNAIQRPGWRPALIRIGIPVLIFVVTLTNNIIQYNIGEANASRVVAACEQFHVDNGRLPKTLDELVPDYLPYVPRAKYCLFGTFAYSNSELFPHLTWFPLVPCSSKVYYFNERAWHHRF